VEVAVQVFTALEAKLFLIQTILDVHLDTSVVLELMSQQDAILVSTNQTVVKRIVTSAYHHFTVITASLLSCH